jgi:hypothetical protein
MEKEKNPLNYRNTLACCLRFCIPSMMQVIETVKVTRWKRDGKVSRWYKQLKSPPKRPGSNTVTATCPNVVLKNEKWDFAQYDGQVPDNPWNTSRRQK